MKNANDNFHFEIKKHISPKKKNKKIKKEG